jgi:dTDP-4-dehydrorhamnose 3,5-epimerase
MKITETNLNDAYIIKNEKYDDVRGFFIETFNLKEIKRELGIDNFVQDNHSRSVKGVLRGLHYQIKHPQGKLVRCISGEIYDVIVDLRKSSKTFGKWFGIKLCSPNIQVWVPSGFAHGFYTLSDTADVCYKITDYYYPEYDRTLIWNDKDLDIVWPSYTNLIISDKDLKGKEFSVCEKYD